MAIQLKWSDLKQGPRPAAAVVLVTILVMAAAVLLGLHVTRSIQLLRESAVRTSEQVGAVAAVLAILDDAEAAERGFVLTMRPSALEPYWPCRPRLQAALERLDHLAADSPWMPPEARGLRQAALARMAEMDHAIFIARSLGREAALTQLTQEPFRASINTVRERVRATIFRANSERDKWTAQLAAQERNTLLLVTLGAVFGTFLLGYTSLRLLLGRSRLVRTQAELHDQRQRLQGTVDHIPVGVAVFDAQDRLLLWNPSFFPTTGLPRELAAEGMAFSRLAAAMDWTPPLLAGPRPSEGAVIAETSRVGAVLEVWRSAMPDGGQMLAVSDITRRTEAEAIARQAQKMEALGQLTGGVAHDFNNLLQVVSANLDLISTRLQPDPTKAAQPRPDRLGADIKVADPRTSAADPSWLRARLIAAQAGVERGARLTRHLLAFARRQPLAPEAIDPARLLRSMEDMLRRALGAAVEMELRIETDLWAIRADPHQLENALLNLAINGRDAIEAKPEYMTGADGGRLAITAANAEIDAAFATQHPDVTPGAYVRIDVTDTGTGMNEAATARAVEPFYTTKGEGKGTGLGLSMVYGFARQSGGLLRINSAPGRGTTVTLFIPRTSSVPERVVSGPAPIVPNANGETVLVVEDDAAVRAAAVETLRTLGYRILAAEHGAAAMELLAAGARPDILFTDMVMPGPPGARALAEQARAMHPRLAVLFTSGFSEHGALAMAFPGEGIVHGGELDPGVQLIAKPWRTEELARRLREVLDHARQARRDAPRQARASRVLLVEDDHAVRETAAELLTDAGYAVFQAPTGIAALELLDRGIDILVADLGLPDMDGMYLVRLALTRHPGLGVVLASGRRETGVDDARIGFLDKPYNAAALRHAVTEAGRAVARALERAAD